MNYPKSTALLTIFAALATSCVTVNVNFPESAVQKATDDYVRELYRAKEKGAPNPAPQPTKTSLLGSLFPEAWAADAPAFRVDSPKSMEIRDKLAGRVEEVITQKRAGFLGESNDGLLVLRSGEKLKPLLKKRMEKLVEDENADRTALYEEVLRSNAAAKNRIKDIQRSFARSFQAESPSGTWVQDNEGAWSQKP